MSACDCFPFEATMHDHPQDSPRPTLSRRGFVESAVRTALAGLGAGFLCLETRGEDRHAAAGLERRLGIPGPFPGRVVEVRHPGALKARRIVREAVSEMVGRGMRELTGAPEAAAAWRSLFSPGEVVGIKVNPVGSPFAISSHELVHSVVAGLESAGVSRRDIIVFDRYRAQFIKAGYLKNLPEGVRWDASVEDYDPVQLDIDGYDSDVYREIELVSRDHHDPSDPRTRRSHLSLIVSRKVEKIINLPVLKDHASAGVTLALKNMSHGFVNNVARSHGNPSTNACNTFIPAICSMPQIRAKVVLHILDGLRGMFDGGPGGGLGTTWDHHTLYFATDPVAMDRIGWEVVDQKRLAMGLPVVAESRWIVPKDPGEQRRHSFRQPEHIELSAALGLGVFDREKIELYRCDLSAG
jgi:uncharacterized protein (DUF362 family)